MAIALSSRAESTPDPTVDSRTSVACFVLFAIVWTVLAINPHYRDAWLLENLLIFASVPTLVLTRRRFRFSDRAYVQITAFLLLHAIGSHYTYSEVPAGAWARDAMDLSRNHYDRVVHFAFGFLFLRPLLELSIRRARGLGPYAIAWIGLAGIAALSTAYELLEWLAAIAVEPDAGTAFLGTQGDIWDAQKDTALACGGAIVALWFEPLDTGGEPPAADAREHSQAR